MLTHLPIIHAAIGAIDVCKLILVADKQIIYACDALQHAVVLVSVLLFGIGGVVLLCW